MAQRLVNLLSLPLMIILTIGGVVGAVWLALLSQWTLLIHGGAFIVVAPFFIVFALTPARMLMRRSANHLRQENVHKSSTFAVYALTYNLIILSILCSLAFTYFVSQTSDAGILPRVLWAFATTTLPWWFLMMYEIKKLSARNESLEHANSGAAITFYAAFGTLCMAASYLIFQDINVTRWVLLGAMLWMFVDHFRGMQKE